VAAGGHRGRSADRELQLRAQPRQAAQSAPPRGRYLLRTNLYKHQAEKLWKFYIQPSITAVIAKPPNQAL
jgi:hypothetical protein